MNDSTLAFNFTRNYPLAHEDSDSLTLFRQWRWYGPTKQTLKSGAVLENHTEGEGVTMAVRPPAEHNSSLLNLGDYKENMASSKITLRPTEMES